MIACLLLCALAAADAQLPGQVRGVAHHPGGPDRRQVGHSCCIIACCSACYLTSGCVLMSGRQHWRRAAMPAVHGAPQCKRHDRHVWWSDDCYTSHLRGHLQTTHHCNLQPLIWRRPAPPAFHPPPCNLMFECLFCQLPCNCSRSSGDGLLPLLATLSHATSCLSAFSANSHATAAAHPATVCSPCLPPSPMQPHV